MAGSHRTAPLLSLAACIRRHCEKNQRSAFRAIQGNRTLCKSCLHLILGFAEERTLQRILVGTAANTSKPSVELGSRPTKARFDLLQVLVIDEQIGQGFVGRTHDLAKVLHRLAAAAMDALVGELLFFVALVCGEPM